MLRPSALVGLALSVAACATDPAAPPGPSGPVTGGPVAPADTVSVDPAPPGERPETVRDTIEVEGMDEVVTLRLVSFPDAPLPFSTYVREGWETDVVGSGEGTAVRLTLGEPPRQGVLSLFVPAGASSEAGAAEFAQAALQGEGREAEAAEPWARRTWTAQDGDTVSTAHLGRHAGAFFVVLESYPVEMGDGFVPAARVALDRLRWLDDGTGL